MATAYSRSPISTEWAETYKAAIFEDDSCKIPQRIADAERALIRRVNELFQMDGGQVEERQAIENAMYFLRVLANTQGVDSSIAGLRLNHSDFQTVA